MNLPAEIPHPKYLNLALWTEMSCRPRMDGSAKSTDDNTCMFNDGPLEVSCRGSRWSAVIDNVFGALICTVSLARELAASGLKLGGYFPLKIVGVDGGAKWQAAPDYVFFRPTRGLRLNPDYFDWPEGSLRAKSGIPYRRVPIPGSWNQHDLFGTTASNSRALMVTQAFLLAAKSNNWESFLFSSLDIPHDRYLESVIRIGREKWPPVWYPEGVKPHPDNQ